MPDTGILFDEFAQGLRAAYGKLPIAGIPRITRPRRRQGTSSGFSVVDPGGNWLRVTAGGGNDDVGQSAEETSTGRLERVLQNAARQGDARGNEQAAISVLQAGLARHPDATGAERLPVLIYLAELFERTGQHRRALAALDDVDALVLEPAKQEALVAELAQAAQLRLDLTDGKDNAAGADTS